MDLNNINKQTFWNRTNFLALKLIKKIPRKISGSIEWYGGLGCDEF
jgi:hypothetical protein